MGSKNTCEFCRYLYNFQHSITKKAINECRKNPPIVTSDIRGESEYDRDIERWDISINTDEYTSFPIVKLDWWCGEWRKK